jgi:glycosyltransferase involved in cell wall biosynthesis
LNGLWSDATTLKLFKERHRAKPYDLVIVWNMKGPQIACANYSLSTLRLPVILQYEDDFFSSVHGERFDNFKDRMRARTARRLLRQVSGCIAVSPYLRSQLPEHTPSLILRGVVGADIVRCSHELLAAKRNVVLFAGTHVQPNGVVELIKAWKSIQLPGWELHITGYGQLTEVLREMARDASGIAFHGLVDRAELVSLMCSARICVNPFMRTEKPGSVFAFKIIEYLASGAHVITSPMGVLEAELEKGITYMPDNSPENIARTLRAVIEGREYERLASRATQERYGPEAVGASLDTFVREVAERRAADSEVFGENRSRADDAFAHGTHNRS